MHGHTYRKDLFQMHNVLVVNALEDGDFRLQTLAQPLIQLVSANLLDSHFIACAFVLGFPDSRKAA